MGEAMLERVARAIYAANSWWRAVEDDDDGLGRYKDGHGSVRFRAIEWEQLPEEDRQEHLGSARAAIEAMREPTEEMGFAGLQAWDPGIPSHGSHPDHLAANPAHWMRPSWRAMIDAILSPPATEGRNG